MKDDQSIQTRLLYTTLRFSATIHAIDLSSTKVCIIYTSKLMSSLYSIVFTLYFHSEVLKIVSGVRISELDSLSTVWRVILLQSTNSLRGDRKRAQFEFFFCCNSKISARKILSTKNCLKQPFSSEVGVVRFGSFFFP